MRKMYPLNLKKNDLPMSKNPEENCNIGPDEKTLCFLMQFARAVRPLQSENPETDYLSIN